MTVLSAQTIRQLCQGPSPVISPFEERTQHEPSGTSFGLSSCGYDIRLDQPITIKPGSFVLASSMEEFRMWPNFVGIVHDKSTWARHGLAVQNTVIEPGWRGFLTLEITNHGRTARTLLRGTPIAQVIFHRLDALTDLPYSGKYQDQERGAQGPR